MVLTAPEVLRLFRRYTHTPPCLRQGGARKNEMKMWMNGEWKWDESEDEMKVT